MGRPLGIYASTASRRDRAWARRRRRARMVVMRPGLLAMAASLAALGAVALERVVV